MTRLQNLPAFFLLALACLLMAARPAAVLAGQGAAPQPSSQSAPPSSSQASPRPSPQASNDPAPQAAAAEPYVAIPGTRVSLQLPEGFSISDSFPGIEREELGAMVVVSEMPAPLQKILAGLTKDEMDAQGITLLGTRQVTVNGMDGTLFDLKQDDSDGPIHKWLLLFGNDKATVVLSAAAPEMLETVVSKSIETCLLAAKWDSTKELDPYEGLGFSLRQSETFEVRGRRPGGILLARKEAPEQLTPSEPILVVYSATEPEVAPLQIFAKNELTQNSQFTDFSNFSERSLTVNGLKGYEIIADAKEPNLGVAVRILLVAVRTPDQDMVIEGIVAPESWEKYIPEFHGLAESFRVTKDRGSMPGM
jgi:hypothetical protein